MRSLARKYLLAAAGTGAFVGGCFTGAPTLGAICEVNADCGDTQSCDNNVCGQCGNGVVDVGEFCYGDADETRLGGEVRLIVDGDFDEDGDLDLLAAGNTSCGGVIGGPCWSITLLINRGDGSFESVEFESAAGHIESVELGDFNDNDDLDAAVTLQQAPALVVVYDLFSAREITNLPTPGDARSVRQVDIDSDGDLDLLTAAEAPIGMPGSVFAFRNDGLGQFGPAEPIEANPSAWLGPIADLNGDNNPDLLVANRSLDQVTVLHGDGQGGFEIVQELAAGAAPQFLNIIQIDDENRLDIAVANSGDASVTLYRGIDGGRFAEGEQLPTGPSPSFIQAADVNQDQWPDLLIANQDDDKLSIYLNRFGEFPDVVEFDVGAAPNWIVHGDYSGDGWPDLVVASGDDISFSYGDF